eukprot:COSAG01_NODE_44876_length_414_cov_2.304762_1_plen_83_part_00
MIQTELDAAQERFVQWTPYAPEMRTLALKFTAHRRAHGASGRWYSQFPRFDDNSMAVFSLHLHKTYTVTSGGAALQLGTYPR